MERAVSHRGMRILRSRRDNTAHGPERSVTRRDYSMEKEYKNISGEVKEISEKGEGLAIISTLNVVDSDGDVVVPGAFGEQIAQIVPAHDWQAAPIGKASIKENGDTVLAEFKLNLFTSLGKDWYSALKFDVDNPPVKQQYSYGFSVLEEGQGEFEGQQVRFLKKLKVHEISPVLVGASVGTTTLALKEEKKKTTLEEEIEITREHIKNLLTRVKEIQELRAKDNRTISNERIKELIDIKSILMEIDTFLEPPFDDPTGVIADYHDIQKRLIEFRKKLL